MLLVILMRKIIFPQLLLNNTQFSKLPKVFVNNSAANIKSSKTQLHKIAQSGGFLGKLSGPLIKTGFPLIGNVLKPLAKSIFIPLGLTAVAVAAATGEAIYKKMFGSGNIALIISNEEMNYIMKIITSLKESGLLIKGISKTFKNEAKEQKGEFLSMLTGTLGAIRKPINRQRHNYSM